MESKLTFGLPRMHFEAGEKRDFLPDFVASLEKNGAQVYLEHGYGSGMGLDESDYTQAAPLVEFTDYEEIFQKDYVLVVRCPSDEDLRLLKPNSCLITMAHYPTRPQRIEFLRSLGVEVISLDSIKDETGRRLVENLRSVAWNGLEVAFETLQKIYPAPGFFSHERNPIHVTLLGAGGVGTHVVQAAIRYGDTKIWNGLAVQGFPGVQVTVVDYDTTRFGGIMRDILALTDMLVDATQRQDTSQPVIPNDWIAWMPEHAVLVDLSVDPYRCGHDQIMVKGIEGIPQGNLDQYVFAPDDPAFNSLPDCVCVTHRRYSISCYSWPGIHPKECMRVYGHQLRPLMRALIERGEVQDLNPKGRYFERALCRAILSRWPGNGNHAV